MICALLPLYTLRYIDILVLHCVIVILVMNMSTAVSIRLPDDVVRGIEELAASLERSKTYVIRKAIESYLKEYADYLIALERLRDKDDEIISGSELRERLGL